MITLEYVKVAHYTKDTSCPHNEGLTCREKNCYHCGWNPKVAAWRLEKIVEKRKKELA
jgi:hypothetical protein